MGHHLLLLFFLYTLFVFSSPTIADENKRQTYIVQVRNDMKPNVFSTVNQWYRSTLATLESSTPDDADQDQPPMLHVYSKVFRGFSARLTKGQAEEMKARPEVLNVFPDQIHQLHTTRSPQFLGILNPHDQNKNKNHIGLLRASDYGSNVIIGVLDTGIWPERESFHDRGLGPVPSHWAGHCDKRLNFTCNRKIIGARVFLSGTHGKTPRDFEGHGTHTASTAAGRAVKNASFFGLTLLLDSTLQFEMALISSRYHWVRLPKALITIQLRPDRHCYIWCYRSWRVCICLGREPDLKTLRFLMYAPWITTVGASSIDRNFPVDLVLGNGRVVTGSSFYDGKSLPRDKFFPIFYPGNLSNCDPGTLDPKQVRGKIVFCYVGNTSLTFTFKGVTVKKAGGVGMVLANEDAKGENILNEAHVLPTVLLNAKLGHVAFDYLAKSPNPKATIVSRGTRWGSSQHQSLVGFHREGLTRASINILETRFDRARCRHPSGLAGQCVAALLKGAHRDWSIARIRSAMMTTSYVRDNVGNHILDRATNRKASAWGYGSGHVDPVKAIDPGLVFDLTVDDYVQFLCGSGYIKKDIQVVTRRAVKCNKNGIKPWDLNYPSISVLFDDDETRKFEVAVTRTATLVSKIASTYTVKIESPKGFLVSVNPSKLVFNRAEEKQSYVVNISAANNKLPPVHDPSLSCPDLVERPDLTEREIRPPREREREREKDDDERGSSGAARGQSGEEWARGSSQVASSRRSVGHARGVDEAGLTTTRLVGGRRRGRVRTTAEQTRRRRLGWSAYAVSGGRRHWRWKWWRKSGGGRSRTMKVFVLILGVRVI
ncbi:hypothetical protein Syun_028757 [Stephania yunnanensis]|uniref:Subtilisin n=1 Tax=Stephania yunnanensis TaxID=152371 RepID=A0AAP0EC34_9MAGN